MSAPSASYRWKILFLLTSAQALAYTDRVNLSVAGPVLIRLHHYSPALLGVLFSIFNWTFTLAILVAGPLSDLVRARVAYSLGVGIWSTATILCGLTTSFAPLAIARALVGVGEGPTIPAGGLVIRETFEEHHRASAVGTFFAGNKLRLALGIPFASIILARWGWPWVFYVTGALGIVWVVAWLTVYRPPSREAPPTQRLHNPAAAIRWSTLLRYRTTWGIMVGQAGYLYIYYVFATWLPGYLVLQRHMSILNSGFVGMLPFVVGIGCTVAGGWLGDMMVSRGVGKTFARKAFAVGGLFAATIFTILGALSPASMTILAIVFLTLSIASFSFATAAVNSMTIDIAPPHVVSSLVSLQNFGGNVGGSFAPVVTGVLLANTGSFLVPLLVTAGVALIFGCGAFGLIVGDLEHQLRPPTDRRRIDGGEIDRPTA